MPSSKEIRGKIKSVQSTRKITKAMEMVAASKMSKAQERMRASRPYLERLFNIAIHVAQANTEYKHPFLHKRDTVKRVGAIVVTTDKGLCGGLNTNVLRLLLQKHKEWTAAGLGVDYVALGSKGLVVRAAHGRQRRRERGAARRPPAPRPHRRPGQVAARQVHGGRDRRGVGSSTRRSSTR
jgi:ATP synthase F1 gamma subunit